MARREYVSFFGERRRDFGSYDMPSPARWLWIITALVLLAISVWWFGFRDADEMAQADRVLEDTTIPTILTPAASGDDDDGDGIDANVECRDLGDGVLVEEWTTFQGSIERQGCVSGPRIESPRIMWRSDEVGISGWLNNPVIHDGAVYVGSAGVAQFSHDRRDGIYSLDLETGNQRWFYATELDVNAVSVRDGLVVATGDEGRIWALDAGSGRLLWTDDLQVGVFASPLMLEDMIVIGAGDGSITPYDYDGNRLDWQRLVEGPIRGGLSSDGERIYAAGENHEVLALNMQGEQVWRTDIEPRRFGPDEARIFAAPTVTESLVIITLVRPDTAADPAVVALDKDSGDVVWQSEDAAALKQKWANIRSSPAVVGDYVVFGEGYSNELIVLDLATGESLWSAAVGEFCYPHWPSVAVNSGYAYIARHDGGLYAVDLADPDSEEPVWSIYLGQADGQGNFPDGLQCNWGPEEGYSILASPAVSPEGAVVVGTLEGHILAVGDSDW